MQRRVQRSEVFRFYTSLNIQRLTNSSWRGSHATQKLLAQHNGKQKGLVCSRSSSSAEASSSVTHLQITCILLSHQCFLPPHQPFTPWQNVEAKFAYIRKLDVLASAVFTGISLLGSLLVSAGFPGGFTSPHHQKRAGEVNQQRWSSRSCSGLELPNNFNSITVQQ